MYYLLFLIVAFTFVSPVSAGNPQEMEGYRTIYGAKVSPRPNPIPSRYVYGEERDWHRKPYRLAAILVEFSDKKHEAAHTAAMYEKLLFSRDEYHKTLSGEPVYGSVADWYRIQSSDQFVLSGKAFDWVTVDEPFEAIHVLKMKDAKERYLRVALAKIRARDGKDVLDDFDGYVFIHVGPITGPSGNIFWSHRSDVEKQRYVTTGEIESIGVFCHEFGHILGLPDFYGKKGERESFGPWCAMASGYRGKYPKSFCAWSKIRIGWSKPTVVDSNKSQKLVLRPIQNNPNDIFIIPLNSHNEIGAEFLLLENRSTAGNDEEGQAGLFIWRINRSASSGSFPHFELKLPGPADTADSDQKTRRVAWPTPKAHDYVVSGEGDMFPTAIRNIRLKGGNVYFEIGPK